MWVSVSSVCGFAHYSISRLLHRYIFLEFQGRIRHMKLATIKLNYVLCVINLIGRQQIQRRTIEESH